MVSRDTHRVLHEDIAVLTGDLIGSTRLPSAEIDAAFSALRKAALEISFWQYDQTKEAAISTRLTRSRGDGWQMYLEVPRLALRAALYVRTALLVQSPDIRTRIALAEGAGNTGTGGDLNGATGPVFVASGRTLDSMKAPTTMAHAAGGPIGAATRLADHISTGWTQAQARALHGALPPRRPTRTEIAGNLGISRQAVDQALDAAGFGAISDALASIEAAA